MTNKTCYDELYRTTKAIWKELMSRQQLINVCRKVAKIRVEVNRNSIAKINEFNNQIKDKLHRIQEFEDMMSSLQKRFKSIEEDFKTHVEKYPIDEYSMDLLRSMLS
jgi:predicted transcriptional regulator